MEKKIINAENGTCSSRAVLPCGRGRIFVFTSGQIGLDPNTQELAGGIEAEQQNRCLRI